MANLISTDSGHCYDLDDVQSGLRYITEQRLGAVPSHVLALMYNAIEHITRQDMRIGEAAAEADHWRWMLEAAQIELCRQYAVTQTATDHDAINAAKEHWLATCRNPLPPFLPNAEANRPASAGPV